MPYVLPILSRLPWRWIGIALAVAGTLWWAYNRGVSAERGKWQVEVARAEKAAAAKTAALQAQVDAAGVSLSDAQSEIDRLTDLAKMKRTPFYAANNRAADVACLLPERLRAVAEADSANEAASAAK